MISASGGVAVANLAADIAYIVLDALCWMRRFGGIEPFRISRRVLPVGPSSVANATEPELATTAPAATPAVFAHSLAAQSEALEVVAPNVLSMAHWTRLADGELYAAQPRPPSRSPRCPPQTR